MIKPFLTYEQQLKKLNTEKNLIINDSDFALKILKHAGYFSIIGGYKTPFINPMTRIYTGNTTFEDILFLYNFDRTLRDIFFRYICDVELHMRELISYFFCKRHGELQEQYLSASNYDCSTKNKIIAVNKLISILSFHANKNNEHRYLTHQRIHHKNVPLWATMKALTFGQTSKFYSLLKFPMKTDICHEFVNINEDTLASYLEKLCLIRNVCAHNERLYSFRFDKDFPDTKIHRKLGIPMKGEQYISGKNDLFGAVIALKYLLPSEYFCSFKNELVKCINCYLKNSSRITRSELYRFMGFPANWEVITRCSL